MIRRIFLVCICVLSIEVYSSSLTITSWGEGDRDDGELGDGGIMGNVSLVPLLGNFVGCLCRKGIPQFFNISVNLG